MKLELHLIALMDGLKFGVLPELLSHIVFVANKEAGELCFGPVSLVMH